MDNSFVHGFFDAPQAFLYSREKHSAAKELRLSPAARRLADDARICDAPRRIKREFDNRARSISHAAHDATRAVSSFRQNASAEVSDRAERALVDKAPRIINRALDDVAGAINRALHSLTERVEPGKPTGNDSRSPEVTSKNSICNFREESSSRLRVAEQIFADA